MGGRSAMGERGAGHHASRMRGARHTPTVAVRYRSYTFFIGVRTFHIHAKPTWKMTASPASTVKGSNAVSVGVSCALPLRAWKGGWLVSGLVGTLVFGGRSVGRGGGSGDGGGRREVQRGERQREVERGGGRRWGATAEAYIVAGTAVWWVWSTHYMLWSPGAHHIMTTLSSHVYL